MAALYLDYCASTPIDKRVLEAMNDVYVNHYTEHAMAPDNRRMRWQ